MSTFSCHHETFIAPFEINGENHRHIISTSYVLHRVNLDRSRTTGNSTLQGTRIHGCRDTLIHRYSMNNDNFSLYFVFIYILNFYSPIQVVHIYLQIFGWVHNGRHQVSLFRLSAKFQLHRCLCACAAQRSSACVSGNRKCNATHVGLRQYAAIRVRRQTHPATTRTRSPNRLVVAAFHVAAPWIPRVVVVAVG